MLIILQAKRGALELFTEQLPNITPKVRVEVTPIIVKIAMAIHKPLLGQLEDDLASLSFQALESITSSMCAGEETVLSNIVPQVMSYIGARNTVLDALNLLRSLV